MTLVALSSRDSTLVFRSLLRALSSPGERCALPAHLCAAMPPRALPLLALADLETTFCAPDEPVLEAEIAALTGSRVVAPADADFVLCSTPPPHEFVAQLGRGTSLRPELGCRVIVCTENTASSDVFRLSGPGTRPSATLAADGRLTEFVESRNVAVALPPTGIDCWITSPDGTVVGLPRTTAAERAR